MKYILGFFILSIASALAAEYPPSDLKIAVSIPFQYQCDLNSRAYNVIIPEKSAALHFELKSDKFSETLNLLSRSDTPNIRQIDNLDIDNSTAVVSIRPRNRMNFFPIGSLDYSVLVQECKKISSNEEKFCERFNSGANIDRCIAESFEYRRKRKFTGAVPVLLAHNLDIKITRSSHCNFFTLNLYGSGTARDFSYEIELSREANTVSIGPINTSRLYPSYLACFNDEDGWK